MTISTLTSECLDKNYVHKKTGSADVSRVENKFVEKTFYFIINL